MNQGVSLTRIRPALGYKLQFSIVFLKTTNFHKLPKTLQLVSYYQNHHVPRRWLLPSIFFPHRNLIPQIVVQIQQKLPQIVVELDHFKIWTTHLRIWTTSLKKRVGYLRLPHHRWSLYLLLPRTHCMQEGLSVVFHGLFAVIILKTIGHEKQRAHQT